MGRQAWRRKARRALIGTQPNCWLCGEPMLIDTPSKHDPDRATLDHVVPRSKGGSNELDNLRFAHRRCNMEKADDDA